MIEYFRLNDVSDTYLANELFNIIKNSSKLNSPIDYQRFISFIAILVKGSRYEKLLLIFSIFGKGIPFEKTGNQDANGGSMSNLDSSSHMFNSNGSLVNKEDSEDFDD